MARLIAWLRARTPQQRVAAGLAAAVGVGIGHQAIHARWVVEDAAIAYGFARNLAAGNGLVAFPGGPRVEGYSDPLWVLLLAAFQAVGADPFIVADVLGMVLGSATLVVVWALGRACGLSQPFSVLAALLVALTPQQAIWATSGLENPLMNLLLALCALAVCHEARHGGFPWAALAGLGLALTRPEGPVYAGVAFAVAAVADRAAGRKLRPVTWLAVFGAPFAAYHAARYWYFAWPAPMTYYAKLTEQPFRPLDFASQGWSYLDSYADSAAFWWLFPWLLLGLWAPSTPLRLRDARLVVAVAAFLALASVPWLPPVFVPRLLWVAFAALPFLAWGRPGPLVLGGFGTVAIAFALRANGDWMSGWRWLSAAVVPACVLCAIGLASVWAMAAERRRPVRLLVLAVVLATVGLHTWRSSMMTYTFAKAPAVTPQMTRGRLGHMRRVAEVLQLHRPFTHLDADMGGLMWWGPPDVLSVDAYGLVDIPFALNKSRKFFVDEYVYGQVRPDMAFTKGASACALGTTRFGRVFVPGLQSEGAIQGGEVVFYVRRDLMFAERWTGPAGTIVFEDGPTIEGFRIVAPEVYPGGGIHLEIGVRRKLVAEKETPKGKATPKTREEKAAGAAADAQAHAFTIVAFLASGEQIVASWELAPAYGWVSPAAWTNDEVWHGRFALHLPEGEFVGAHDLGFVVLSPDGVPMVPVIWPNDGTIDTPRYARGEVRFAGAVQIETKEAAEGYAKADAEAARRLAEADDCEGAEAAWFAGLAHRIRSKRWRKAYTDDLSDTLASCWARQVPLQKRWKLELETLERGRRWDPIHPELVAVGKDLAARYRVDGAVARAQGQLKGWFQWYDAAARADPTDSWSRRYAEEARKERLALGRVQSY